MDPDPPPGSICAEPDDRSNVHGRPVWAMAARWPLTETLPDRELICGLASTFAVNVASPCPEAVLSRIQDASDEDVHAQSRVVVTVIDTVPPSGPTDCGVAPTDVAHRTSDGPETSLTLVDPQPTAAHAQMRATRTVHARGNSRPASTRPTSAFLQPDRAGGRGPAAQNNEPRKRRTPPIAAADQTSSVRVRSITTPAQSTTPAASRTRQYSSS